ncbi:uncharacterized protein LOC134543782 isoform X2 [Bacillus rossius redtenbacheri]|uniref:uncharacterized protein LOC134543782 isoform X2 n=1 Tax=Bacillus rossius redtenbacheri TaxID=93214 RepID=UPI002FDEAFEF
MNKQNPGSNFLCYRNVSDLISIMTGMVIQRIVDSIKESNKFSVILDSTQDVAKKEATTVLLRYVENSGVSAKPCERLIKVFTSADVTGANLKSKLVDTLKEGLNPLNMIGQSMDGAGNMRGNFSGLKTLIQNEYDTDFSFHVCRTSHRFALVLEKSINFCPQIRELFSVLEELYRLFNSGHKRHDVFVEKMDLRTKLSDKRKRLKRVQTRWSNKAEAIKVIILCFEEITSALEDFQDSKIFDIETVTLAKGLLSKLNSFNVITALHVAQSVFTVMNPETVSLQGVVIDYGTVQTIINSVKTKIKNLRSCRRLV